MRAGPALLLRPALLLDEGGPRPDHALLVEDGAIGAVGPAAELARARPDARVEDLPGCALLPGTVNAHAHSFQWLLRGLADDRPFREWRDTLYRLAPRIDAVGARAAALLAYGEMLRRGVTTVVDFFYLHHGTNERALAAVEAARAVGIRLVLARSLMDSGPAPQAFREPPAVAERNTRELAAGLRDDALASVMPAPHSVRGASEEMLRLASVLARELGTPCHLHLAEARYEVEWSRERHGTTPLRWLDRIGVLDERLRAVHGVWLDEEEIALLAAARAGVVHCPGSNLFLGDGVAPLETCLRHGVPVALGADSGSANGHASIFGEMRLAALLAKGTAHRSDALGAPEVFRMGTRAGAMATGQAVGALEAGLRADLVAVDLADLSLVPAHRLLENVVHSMESTAVRHVWVDGRAVVLDGRLTLADEAEIVRGAAAAAARLLA